MPCRLVSVTALVLGFTASEVFLQLNRTELVAENAKRPMIIRLIKRDLSECDICFACSKYKYFFDNIRSWNDFEIDRNR